MIHKSQLSERNVREKQICDCTVVFTFKEKVKYFIIYNCFLLLSALRVLCYDNTVCYILAIRI